MPIAQSLCASARANDPIGCALENTTRRKWRTEDAGIYRRSGELPTHAVRGPAVDSCADQYRRIRATATEKLLTSGCLGVEHYDNPTIRAISREAARATI